MFGDPFRDMRPGDRTISVRAFNLAKNHALAQRARTFKTPPRKLEPLAPGLIYVRNDTGGAVGLYHALNLDGPVFSGASDLEASFFAQGVVMKADALATSELRRWADIVITQEPIAPGNVGVARIEGMTPAWVPSGTVVGSVCGGPGAALELHSLGGAEVLWVDSTGDPRIAVVQLGRGVRPYQMIPVALETDGGSNGNATTAPSYTYTATVVDGDDEELGTSLSPTKGRRDGTFTAATAGQGYFANDGSFVLEIAYEVSSTEEECSE